MPHLDLSTAETVCWATEEECYTKPAATLLAGAFEMLYRRIPPENMGHFEHSPQRVKHADSEVGLRFRSRNTICHMACAAKLPHCWGNVFAAAQWQTAAT